MSRPAVFLDRDGTIIIDRHFLGDPAGVELLPGVPAAIARLNAAGIPVIVVTNQSGIGRGMFTEADYERVVARLDELLRIEGAHVDASYHCPHSPEHDAPCKCRKPGTEMYERAIRNHDLDGGRSYYIGDHWRDVSPALAFGGNGVLIPTFETTAEEIELATRSATVAQALGAVVDRVLVEAVGA
jgi:histidinol-phosphate phosphatase family protein